MVTHCSWSLLMRYSKANSRHTSPQPMLVPRLGSGTEEMTHQHRMRVTRKETSRSCWPGRRSWRLSSLLLPALNTTRRAALLWEVSHTSIESQVAIAPQCLGQPQELLLGDLLLQWFELLLLLWQPGSTHAQCLLPSEHKAGSGQPGSPWHRCHRQSPNNSSLAQSYTLDSEDW